MGWAFEIDYRRDELLSGYLRRAAITHGASPFGFMRLHLGDPAFWARDVDRGVVRRHEAALSELSGLSSDAIRAMTLQSWVHALWPTRYSDRRPPAITPWVNATGVFHRLRRRHALQFCPECLAESETIRKRWRLSFVVACRRHERMLSDACPRCDAPFIPHRSLTRTFRCHVCRHDLAHEPKSDRTSSPPTELVMHTQASLYSMLDRAAGCCEVNAATELHGLRALVAMVLTGPKALVSLRELRVGSHAWGEGRHRVEIMRLPGRHQILHACGRLLEEWPYSFRSITDKLGLRQEGFKRYDPLPAWLGSEVERLPCVKTRSVRKIRSGLDQKLDALHARKPRNWRTTRAALMIRAARPWP